MLKALPVILLSTSMLFGLSIEESVAIALNNNPDIKKQELGYQLGDLNLQEQDAKNYGKLTAVASYMHYNLPRTLVPLTPASIFNDPTAVATTDNLFTAGVTYDVALFTGFAQKRTVEIASLQKEMASAQLKLGREQLIYNVKTLYANILSLEAQEDAQRRYIKALESLHATIEAEVKLGKKSKLEKLKSAAALEAARNQRFQFHSNITILRASLAAAMNVEAIDTLDPIGIEMELTTEENVQHKDLERFKLKSIQISQSVKNIEKSDASYYPQVGFSSYYGQNFGPNDDSNKYSGDWTNQEVWQAGVNLRWSIYDFGGRSAASQKAKIQALSSKLEDSKTKLEFRRMLVEAKSKIESAAQSHKSVMAQSALTSESEKIEQIRFDNGAADINDLLVAKARSQLAKSQLITVSYQHRIAHFYLDYLLEQGDKK
ncbi:MAG: hypothetical protein DRG24_00045 [Epsilonproteobacteria bacterium]|nr:MAG: hypothetical protein DRG24_00045 [Campylobacterota bacterium]